MTDRYWRKIEDVENDIENAMQISSILLKLKGYDDDIEKIGDNENNISSNLGKINDNENSISNNLGKIDNISKFLLKSDKDFEKTYNVEPQTFRFNKDNHFFTIFEKEIEHDFIKNSLLFVKNNMYYKYDDLSDDHHRCQHEYNIYDDKNNLIHKYLFNKDTYYDENSNILNTTEEFCIFLKQNYNKIKIVLELHRHNRHGVGNINLEIDNGYIKIEYIEKGFLDNSHLINLNTGSISTNLGKINTNTSSISSNSGKIDTNTGSISTNLGKINTNTSSISTNLGKINTNTSSISTNSGLINTNTSSISTNLGKINTNTSSISTNSGLINTNTSSISTNLGKINTNTSSISTNLGKINTNTSDISDNSGKINTNTSDIEKINELNKNIKSFYNLDQIFIYDIKPDPNNKTVNKDDHFHIFEKEINYNFTKNSYLEIALKVLTELSNYTLIGHFQILCNFCDQDNNLFYTISLSTAMGSINRLSTIKSVFIVPINENMSKIKIDFFIQPKSDQQHRTAKFIVRDINSNKIYLKYFQKTDEMSIKDIQNSLDNVNSISTRVDNLEKSLYLKNLYNDIYHDNDVLITNIFFDKTYTIDAKRNDFIEVYFKLLIKYEDTSNSKHITTNFILYNMENGQELISYSYDNIDYIANSNTDILLNNAFYYNFNEDVNKLKIAITFTKRRSYVKISYSSINNNRLIIKHYGN